MAKIGTERECELHLGVFKNKQISFSTSFFSAIGGNKTGMKMLSGFSERQYTIIALLIFFLIERRD